MRTSAFYWDFENLHASALDRRDGDGAYKNLRFKRQPAVLDVGAILHAVEEHGAPAIQRAYADWTWLREYAQVLNDHALDLVQVFPRGAHAKNGADIRLSIDALEDALRHPHLDCFVLLGGDSDYLPLVQRLHALGRRVVGVGYRANTNPCLAHCCDTFLWCDDLGATPAAMAVVPLPRPVSRIPESDAPATPAASVAAAAPSSPLAARYHTILQRREVRVPSPMALVAGVEEVVRAFTDQPHLPSFDALKERVQLALLARGVPWDGAWNRLKSLLMRNRVFILWPEGGGVGLKPDLATPDALLGHVVRGLARVVGRAEGAPVDAEALAEALLGDAARAADLRRWLDIPGWTDAEEDAGGTGEAVA